MHVLSASSRFHFRFGNDNVRSDSQSVSSYRTDILPPSGDEISLRSLPAAVVSAQQQQQHLSLHQQYQQQQHHPPQHQRSMSPAGSIGDDVGQQHHQQRVQQHPPRRSSRRRPHLEKQHSESGSLISGGGGGGGATEDAVSERVRFDDNVSFIDEVVVVVKNQSSASLSDAVAATSGESAVATSAPTSVLGKLHKVRHISYM